MANLSRADTETYIKILELQKAVVSLEHSANQQSILLEAVLNLLEIGMEEKSTTSPNTCGTEFDTEERNV